MTDGIIVFDPLGELQKLADEIKREKEDEDHGLQSRTPEMHG